MAENGGGVKQFLAPVAGSKTTEAKFFGFWIFCMPFVVSAAAVPLIFLILILGFGISSAAKALSSFSPFFEALPELVTDAFGLVIIVIFLCIGSLAFYIIYLPVALLSALLLWKLPSRMRIVWLLVLPWLMSLMIQLPMEGSFRFFQDGIELTDAFILVGYVNVIAIIWLYIARKRQGCFVNESNN